MRNSRDGVVLYKANITTGGCQGFPCLALPRPRWQSINHFILTILWRLQGLMIAPWYLFYFIFFHVGGGVDTCYTCFCFLYPFLVPFSANLFWRYLHSLFFLFIHSHLHLESLFSSHPILRYTPSRFLCSLEILEILVTGIGIGPRKRGQVDDTYARVWEISVIEPGPGLGGGFVRFYFIVLKTFSLDTMINRREVFSFFFPLRWWFLDTLTSLYRTLRLHQRVCYRWGKKGELRGG